MTTNRMISVVAVCALMGVAGRAMARPDARPAPFPDKASAIVFQGSSDDPAFGEDVAAMRTVLTSNANRWQYDGARGSIATLTAGGAGANRANWANLGTAMNGAAQNMWAQAARDQNFVYYHASHGGNINALNSNMEFGDGTRTATQFATAVKDNLKFGHNEYSSNGTATSCVRTMTFMLQGCNTGGMMQQLTDVLGSKATRRATFPALSDITVLTAADSGECAYSSPRPETGSTWSRAMYGFTTGGVAVGGSLQGNNARSAWDVYRDTARNDTSNANAAYTINAAQGTGNNAAMYERGARPDGSGQYEHPLYRHVQFYPALTFGEGVDGRVNVRAGNTTLDFRLSEHNRAGSDVPISGPIPIMMTLTNASAGFMQADRDLRPLASLGTLPSGDLRFVDYYTFNLTNSGGITFNGASLMLEMESDDAAAAALLGGLRLFRHDATNGWVNTNASWNPFQSKFLLDGITSLGTYAVVVPAPGAVALAGLGGVLVLRRRRVA